MPIYANILLGLHIVSAALWVGAVFMGSIIDPPALKTSTGQQGQQVMVNFIVYQGSRIFPWVYTAMITIFISGILLTWLYPPPSIFATMVLAGKFLALTMMAGNTLYGTLVTWPKIQFATPDEVTALWRPYLTRAYITLGCGIIAFILSVMLR